MATAVLLVIVAVVVTAAWRWWRLSQGDERSVEAFHTMIGRLQRLDDRNHGEEPSPDEPAADEESPHVRVLPTGEPSPGRRTRPRAPIPHPSEPDVVTPSVVAPGVIAPGVVGPGVVGPGRAGGADDAGWGPPVRVRPESDAIATPRPARSRVAETVSATRSRPALFFDDLASAANRPKPAPAIVPIREGDRPWLGTARRYAVPGAAALGAATVSLVALAFASSGGGRQVVSADHPRASGTPPTSSVRVQPAPPAAPPTSSSPTGDAATASPPAPASPGSPASGVPQLTVVSPASGTPGQQVTIAGAGLFSADGLIILRFGSLQAPVVCPNQTTCQAVVPGGAGSPTTGAQAITVSTGAGTSNPLTFTYR